MLTLTHQSVAFAGFAVVKTNFTIFLSFYVGINIIPYFGEKIQITCV
jgi:hypothetical protein